NILYGLYQPNEGEIYIRGERVHFKSPHDAFGVGIGMVHQNRKLIPAHTVIENIMLGHPATRMIVNEKRAKVEVNRIQERFGFNINLDARVWQLDAGEAQIVEIIKALYLGARLLILDEPTSVLTPPETKKLMLSLKDMVNSGLAVIPFITHKLPIVLEISDRITILRNGKVVDRIETEKATKTSLARSMVGKEILFDLTRPEVSPGKEILKAENLSALNDKGFPAVTDLSLSVREGEIFALAGVAGNGQHELTELLMGLRKSTGGKIVYQGKDITRKSIKQRWNMGIGFVPADRAGMGSVAEFSLCDNMAMNLYFLDEYSRFGVMDAGKVCLHTEEAIREFSVKAPGPHALARQLSGGNLQKMILARVLLGNPRLLIVNSATQGLDVGAAVFVQNRILELKKSGAGIIFVSQDLDEVLALGDIVAPIYEGRLMGIFPRDKIDKEKVGLMMSGLEE
ncbi:MAG: ABC transporter ATP-binding protein, partial [Candidatus Auribacterota bacterium]|nr:ABC transporter ATP-binding protein [Candidatus Auribacterota bacterium]